jgi:hypothetical protein
MTEVPSVRRFYAFKDAETGAYYFHNPITNEVVWSPPDSSEVLYPDSLQPYSPDSNPRECFHLEAASQEILATMLFEVPLSRYVDRRSQSQQRCRSRVSLRRRATDTQTSLSHLTRDGAFRNARAVATSLPSYFPLSIHTDQNLVDIATFVRTHFRVYRKPPRKGHVPDDQSVFDDSPSAVPLLKTVDHKGAKAAAKLFAYVLAYGRSTNDKPVSSYVDIINSNLDLVDEAYMQVIRQTRQNPSPECCLRMWQLLLVLATLFLASPVMQPVIRQTLAIVAFAEQKAIAQIAQLAYLRFHARCQVGSHMRSAAAAFIDAIPRHCDECHFTFGASLCELVWRQRKTHPKLKIPVFLHQICAALRARGAFDSGGAFKTAGNQRIVDRVCTDVDHGRNAIADADLTTLTAIFKRWLAMLPGPLVPVEFYPKLSDRGDARLAVQIADALPRMYQDSLAYVIGFLREFVRAEVRTGMAVSAVAMMFGVCVVRPANMNPERMKELYNLSGNFVAGLIQTWDVSDVYPMEEETG